MVIEVATLLFAASASGSARVIVAKLLTTPRLKAEASTVTVAGTSANTVPNAQSTTPFDIAHAPWDAMAAVMTLFDETVSMNRTPAAAIGPVFVMVNWYVIVS